MYSFSEFRNNEDFLSKIPRMRNLFDFFSLSLAKLNTCQHGFLPNSGSDVFLFTLARKSDFCMALNKFRSSVDNCDNFLLYI